MVDTLSRTEPVPTQPQGFDGVELKLCPPMARYSLRARDREILEGALGRNLPGTIGAISDGALMLGPDEWLLRMEAGTSVTLGEGGAFSIVDVAERQIAISIEGDRAEEVIAGGNPLDLSNFPIDTGKRTIFEGVEVILIRESETRFVLEVWRSFAEFVWGVLVKSASEL